MSHAVALHLVSIIAFALLSGCVSNHMAAQSTVLVPTWHVAAPMNHARSAHAVVANDAGIFSLGGTGANRQPVMPVEHFDGAGWRIVGSLPGSGLNAPAAVLLGDMLYLIGGFNLTTNVPTDKMWVYNTRRNVWTASVPLPSPRGGHAAVVHAGRVHVVGGGNARSTLVDHDVYDPNTHSWHPLAPLPRGTGSTALVAHQGTIYAIGGRSGFSDFSEVYVYDARLNIWAPAPSLPLPARGTAGAVSVCGAIHLFGGESQALQTSLGDVLRLDLVAGEWLTLPPLPTPRNFARAAVFKDAVYVIGGNTTVGTSHAAEGSRLVERMLLGCVAR